MSTKTSSKVITLTGTQKPYLERDENLNRYYTDIRSYGLVDEETTNKLFESYTSASGKEKMMYRDQIFSHNARLVISMARKFCSINDNLNDLIEEGNIGLLNAIEKFDASKGTSFQTFALFYIRREINLFKLNYTTPIQQTNRSKTDNVARNLVSDFVQKEHRTPTTDELLVIYNKHRTNKKKKINNARDLINVEFVYIDSLDAQQGEFSDCQSYLDYTSTTSAYNDFLRQNEEDENRKHLNTMIGSLNEKEQKAIRLMYGLETGFEESLASIGLRLGCSSERARQLCVSGLKKMQTAYAKCAR